MTGHAKYVPILKWKMGEYQALQRLDERTKDSVQPFIEIPPVGYDFEAKQDKKTLDEHLAGFGKKLFSKWADRPCFIDMKYIESREKPKTAANAALFVFNSANEAGCGAIPVVSLQTRGGFNEVVRKEIASTGRGVCIRLSADDFDKPNLRGELKELLDTISSSLASTDLMIDLCADGNFVPKAAFKSSVLAMFELIPSISRWRSLILAGTSYPETLQKLEKPCDHVPRQEWSAYSYLVRSIDGGMRVPAFSDYGAAHPSLNELDMRFVQPFAKLRYTTEKFWHISQGKTVRKEGFGQYVEMCEALTRESYFDGPEASAADDYIVDCAKGEASTGNLSTWVWVATNRHITKVVADLANLHGTLEIDE